MKQKLTRILKSRAFKAVICACAYLIYTLILIYALFFALSKLFSFWNIDSGNAQSAPFWMRLPYIYSSQIVSTVVALSVCALLFFYQGVLF